MENENKNRSTFNEVRSSRIKPSRRVSKVIAVVALALVIMAGAIYATYHWQHQKLVNNNVALTSSDKSTKGLDNQLASLNQKVKSLDSQITVLESSNKILTNELAANTKNNSSSSSSTTVVDQTDLSMTVDSATRFEIVSAPSNIDYGLAVELTINNPTKSSIDFVPSSLEVQDSQDSVYEPAPVIANLPSGLANVFAPQTLTPGETIKGTSVFELHASTATTFTLINGTSTYTVTAS